MPEIKINQSESLVVRELITRLRIYDVMSTTLHTAKEEDSLRTIQKLMKTAKVSGIPIVDENWYLKGIITVDDIIRALDKGYIDEPAGQHMVQGIITLEDTFPLTVGISYFEKYSFRRFPVVNKNNRLVGIISGRDVLNALLYEINNEVDKLEELIPESKIHSSEFFYRKFHVEAKNMETAGLASAEIKKFCKRSNFHRKLIRRIGVACFELEINIAVHSLGGSITIVRDKDHIQIIAQDKGPGIEDLDAAMREGFSTANDWVRSYGFGAGMGLPNIKRVSDNFHISSDNAHGTMVTATFNLD